MSSNLRFQVVEEAFKKQAVDVKAPAGRPSEYFAKYVFTRQKCTSICRRMSTPNLLM